MQLAPWPLSCGTHTVTEPVQTPPRPRGIAADLETILLKALEKQPERRYGSVSHLAADIGRYLRNEPITARPVSTFYQLRKLALRNKLPVSLAAGILLAVISFAILATIQAVRIGAERDKALAAHKRAAEARR